jgi:hypothetical protein
MLNVFVLVSLWCVICAECRNTERICAECHLIQMTFNTNKFCIVTLSTT